MNTKLDWPLRIGLLLTTFSWLSYIFYDFNIAIFNHRLTWPVIIENLPAAWGLGFRTAAAALAAITVLFFVVEKDLSKPETTMALRFVVILEAIYFVSFLGGALDIYKHNFFTPPLILEQLLPCSIMGILIPIVLVKLFFQLNPYKPLKGAVKWALIYVPVYVFVFWLNNAGFWVAAVLYKGIDYVSLYPVNLFSFVVTVFGLLLLTLYAVYFTKKSIRGEIFEKLDLKRIGAIITVLGLYPVLIFLLWLFFGSVGGWGTWYAWFLGHGYMTFTAVPLIFIGLPLLFRSYIRSEGVKLGFGEAPSLQLKRKGLNSLLFLTQGLGLVFFTIYSLAYYLTVPSTTVLIGSPIYHPLLQIFDALFFIFTIIVLILSAMAKPVG